MPAVFPGVKNACQQMAHVGQIYDDLHHTTDHYADYTHDTDRSRSTINHELDPCVCRVPRREKRRPRDGTHRTDISRSSVDHNL